MGLLVDGKWTARGYDTDEHGGRFVRQESAFRNWVTVDGAPGPTGRGGFAAEPGRYHLYIARACPWAHRAMVMRAVKGLDALIPFSVTHWLMREDGWTFAPGPGVIPDPLYGVQRLYELYQRADPKVSGRSTVPILWDKKQETIVSNESADIIRMFGSAFDGIGARAGDFYPSALRGEIDAVNARVYDTLNNGVYKAGFATTQAAYEEAVQPVFETLDWLEDRLTSRKLIVGDALTEADVRLWTTLVRFDSVYHGHFKCNVRRLVDYPRLWAYTRALYRHPGVRETVDFTHIKRHYYMSHVSINPTQIVAVGPALDWDA